MCIPLIKVRIFSAFNLRPCTPSDILNWRVNFIGFSSALPARWREPYAEECVTSEFEEQITVAEVNVEAARTYIGIFQEYE